MRAVETCAKRLLKQVRAGQTAGNGRRVVRYIKPVILGLSDLIAGFNADEFAQESTRCRGSRTVAVRSSLLRPGGTEADPPAAKSDG
jgi:hypothetical protein